MTQKGHFLIFVLIVPLSRSLDVHRHMCLYSSARLSAVPVVITKGCSVAPHKGWGVRVEESSNPGVGSLQQGQEEVVGASISDGGDVSNIVGNILLAESSRLLPGQRRFKVFVAATSWRIWDPVILAHCNESSTWKNKEASIIIDIKLCRKLILFASLSIKQKRLKLY